MIPNWVYLKYPNCHIKRSYRLYIQIVTLVNDCKDHGNGGLTEPFYTG